MTAVLVTGAYRFFFCSKEYVEPEHIHIQRDRAVANFWLEPIMLARSTEFTPDELIRGARLVGQHKATFQEAWNEHSGG